LGSSGKDRGTALKGQRVRFKETDPTGTGFKEGRRIGIPPAAFEPRIQFNSTWENRKRFIGRAEGG
jgi:hypothetical protein